MPGRPPSLCRYAGCRELVSQPGYCPTHRSKDDYTRHAWRTTRRQVLATHPACQCGRQADVVDHITPRSQGGSDEPTNLRPMCHRCHGQRTKE